MKYLISKFECVLKGEQDQHIIKNVPYAFDEFNKDMIVVGDNNQIPFLLSIEKENKNCLVVECGGDEIYILFPTIYVPTNFAKLKHQNKDIFVCVSNEISVCVGDDLVLSEPIENITYSHFENVNDYCVIFFSGIRNYVVILKNLEVKVASYYDEFNIDKKEYYFMCKLKDFNNHGKVIHLSSSSCEEYFVYLGNGDIEFKDKFVSCAFLDLIENKNYDSANNLLADVIKLDDANEIKMFFKDFDDYVVFKENYILTNKNALAGIYKFEVNQNKIENIISL